jgi:predicted RNA-binding Zn-ribbon protein involved in translation (DUF1610 family)
MATEGAILIVGAVLVALAFCGALAAWSNFLAPVERLRQSAPERLASLACPRCGAVVGVEAAAEARARREEHLQRLREEARNSLVRLRIDPFWRFPCPACGAELRFDPTTERDPLAASENGRHAALE